MISRIGIRLRRWRRKFNRSRLAAHLFGGQKPTGSTDQRGLIMLQIDGLSRRQMERAMAQGNLPFLSKLIKRDQFSIETFYSGVPSTTPSVQAEIFYGIRTAVPAFHFLRRSTGNAIRMYEAESVAEVEKALRKKSTGSLIEGGHSYSNIYRAGSARSRYCVEDVAPDEFFRNLHPFKSLILAVVYAPRLLRMGALAVLELIIAIGDLFRGLYDRRDLLKEIKFVMTRVVVCIVLRELIRLRVLLDIERGVQVVHANFLGYDEQAHRRGPDSAFAHWSLLGIDRVIRDIYRAAHGSDYRDYELIVYSDHGQECSEPFFNRHQRSLREALADVFSKGPLADFSLWQRPDPVSESVGVTLDRCRNLLGMTINPDDETRPKPDLENEIVITAMGPIGHIYIPCRLTEGERIDYAKRLVGEGGIPLVLMPDEKGRVKAFNRQGIWILPGDRVDILGSNHPLLKDVATDLVQLCQHTNAGDFIISGWDPHQKPLTFPTENGAHGGPGSEETRGFVLLPDRIRRWHRPGLSQAGKRIRGDVLRRIAFRFLGREKDSQEQVPDHPPRDVKGATTLRIMTYNIHSCQGIDGKIRPERIARVINAFDPDIVAVQEVDAHRPRSGGHNQAQVIADHLRMTHVFQTMLEEKKERYGIAVFSKYPFEVIQAGLLTPTGWRREARGAMLLRFASDEQRSFYFINTHFGLTRRERREQASRLVSEEWIGGIPPSDPIILCGDFNSGPRSPVYRLLRSRLDEAWIAAGASSIRPSFPSIRPLLRLDHIFVSSHFSVERVHVPNTLTATLASDHLPLCAEMKLRDNDATS